MLRYFKRFIKGKSKINYYKKIGVNIGDECEFIGSVSFGSEPYMVNIGKKCKLADGVKFITHDGGIHVIRNLKNMPDIDKFGNIIIGENVFVGMNTIILPNVKIGDNSIIGAGSIVTKEFQSNSVIAGIPAKRICSIEEYFQKSKDDYDFTKNLSVEEKKRYLEKKFNLVI